jgi:hypothetical protein
MIVNSSRAQILKKQFHKEGIMARIRVNTDDLKTKAKDFDSAAEAFNRAGDDILAAAMAMPSYDGQLTTPARKAGYAIQTQARALGAALAGDAESLRKAAQDFENVDNQAIDSFTQNQEALLSDSLYGGGPGEEDDDDKIGTTVTTFVNPDGSILTVTVTRTRNPDGSITEVRSERTKKVLTKEDADRINKGIEDGFGAVYWWINKIPFFGSWIVDFLKWLSSNPVEYNEGDVIVSEVIIVTTEYSDGTREWESTTKIASVTDKNGNIISSEKTIYKKDGTIWTENE